MNIVSQVMPVFDLHKVPRQDIYMGLMDQFKGQIMKQLPSLSNEQ